jgi:predicted enzyme related to lactoylglutathione lyase
MTRVTGLGGVFIKANDPKALCAWYEKHLGIPFGDNTYVDLKDVNQDPAPGSTVFSFFPQSTTYFAPSSSPFMINFRVKDLSALAEQLKSEGISLEGEIMEESYGKFGWLMDPEGNKVELWQPIEG